MPTALDLETAIRERTSRRVAAVRVELSDAGVTLHGSTHSYYVKQLATCAVRELLPHAALWNAIRVER